MTPLETHAAQIQLLSLEHALQQLRQDLELRGTVYTWTYLIDYDFAADLLGRHLQHSKLYAIIDHRMRGTAAKLQRSYPTFSARSWSYNRTMHEKTFILPETATTWLGSHNMTRGSYTLSMNRSARITSLSLCKTLEQIWWDQWQTARALPRHTIL